MLGSVQNYVEPFCGSAAVLLARPQPFGGAETINDADCFVANFYRAVKADAGAVAEHADWPVNEADLVARRDSLLALASLVRERTMADPDWFDPRAAGWWLWGRCASIGDSWTVQRRKRRQQLPQLSTHGQGIHALSRRGRIADELRAVAARLRHVRVACGDWTRVLAPGITYRFGNSRRDVVTGVFLDPPYRDQEAIYDQRDPALLRPPGRRPKVDDRPTISAAVRRWAEENGDHPALRIVLCGRTGEHDSLGWSRITIGSDCLWASR